MPIAWIICPYKRRKSGFGIPYNGSPIRYCAMDDFTKLIYEEGGDWSESEILGDHAIVKIRAGWKTIEKISAETGFTKLPKVDLSDNLSDLISDQKTAITEKIVELGYSADEIKNTLGDDIGTKTFKELLKFMAKRRLKPRYDRETDTIICDGVEQKCRSIEELDNAVKEK